MGTASILIVEDEAIIALDIRGALQQLGYSVCGIAATGDEAIGLASDYQPDLVLMDIGLAGDIDGIETAHRIREALSIPIIFLTAYDDQATLERANVAQPDGYIKKPLDITELHTAIERTLNRSTPGS